MLMWEVSLSGSSSEAFLVRTGEPSQVSVDGSGTTQTHFDERSFSRPAATPI
jgi:hypothetical protein